MTQGVAPGVPAQRGRRLNAGDAKRGGAARISPETGYGAPFGPRYSAFESGGEAASFWGYGMVGAGVHRRRRPQRRRSEVGHGWSGARGVR